MEEFESIDLIDELESRGFTVIDETENSEILDFLREVETTDICDECERRDYFVFGSAIEAFDYLKDDYLSELVECVQNSDAGVFIENPHKSIDFRMTDCKGLIEDIVKRRGWNYLHELLISC